MELKEIIESKNEHIKTLELSNKSIRNTLLVTKGQLIRVQQDYAELLKKSNRHQKTASVGEYCVNVCLCVWLCRQGSSPHICTFVCFVA